MTAPSAEARPAASEPGDGLEYHELQRRGRSGWWRPVVGSLALVVLGLLVVPLVLQIAFGLGYVARGEPFLEGLERLLDLDDPTPLSLAYLNLVLAATIPVVWFLNRALHGLSLGWLSSVAPRIRWRWLVVCLGLSMLALIATVLVAALVPTGATAGTEVSGELNDFTARTRDFALVVLLLTPLQAAGEEYAFRGYLTQVFGGLARSRWVAVLGPALLFALAHGAQDPPIFVDRFAFGIIAGVLVIATGGLEAGIAMHVLNNWLALGLGLAFGDIGSSLNPTGGTWWSLPVTLTQSLVFLGLVLWVARRVGVERRTPVAVLERPDPRV